MHLHQITVWWWKRILWHIKRTVSICTEIQIPMQLSPFKQCWKRYLQAHKIFTTVNAEFSELKQILYKCKIWPQPTWTNSYHSYVIQNSWLVFLVFPNFAVSKYNTSPTYRNERWRLFLKMPEDKFFSLFSSRVLLQENISKYWLSQSFKMMKDLNVFKY